MDKVRGAKEGGVAEKERNTTKYMFSTDLNIVFTAKHFFLNTSLKLQCRFDDFVHK